MITMTALNVKIYTGHQFNHRFVRGRVLNRVFALLSSYIGEDLIPDIALIPVGVDMNVVKIYVAATITDHFEETRVRTNVLVVDE